MRIPAWSLLPLALVLGLAAAPRVAAEEAVDLRWKVAPGDRYRVEKTNVTRTLTTTHVAGQDQEQSEQQTAVVVHGLEVLAVAEDGNLSMRFTTHSGRIEKTGGQQGHEMTMKRLPSGEKLVEVEVPGLGPNVEATRRVIESLGGELLDLKVDFELTPRGEVVSSKIVGTLFEHLPEDDETMILVGKVLREILPREEFAGAAVGDGFPILPETAVAVGGSWPVARQIDVMGLSMSGEGQGHLMRVEGGTAHLEETLRYAVDPSGLGRRMERMLSVLYEEMGMPITVSMSFDPVEPVDVKATTTFDVEDGFVSRTTWETMKVDLDGLMEMSVMGETQNATLSVKTEAEVKLVWSKVPR